MRRALLFFTMMIMCAITSSRVSAQTLSTTPTPLAVAPVVADRPNAHSFSSDYLIISASAGGALLLLVIGMCCCKCDKQQRQQNEATKEEPITVIVVKSALDGSDDSGRLAKTMPASMLDNPMRRPSQTLRWTVDEQQQQHDDDDAAVAKGAVDLTPVEAFETDPHRVTPQ